jgi:F0F1-type ATP synthase assembly protein I
LLRNPDVSRARKIIVAQAIATLLIALASSPFGIWTGFVALLGGATATVANALFAFWVFGRYRASEPGRLTGQIYGGEFLKLGFIVAAFAIAVVWLQPFRPLAFFGSFFLVHVVPPILASRSDG